MLGRGYPAYTTSAGWLGYGDDKIRRLCREGIAAGWEHFKIKVGADLDDDIRRVALVREEIGPDRKLMLDANQRWDVPEAIESMRALARFNPYLTGAVLKGIAGRYAEIELQLFPESTKDIELYLLDRGIPYAAAPAKRYAGDRATAASVLSLEWNGVPLKLTVLDPRDERLALKTSVAGRVIDRAGIAQVSELVGPSA